MFTDFFSVFVPSLSRRFRGSAPLFPPRRRPLPPHPFAASRPSVPFTAQLKLRAVVIKTDAGEMRPERVRLVSCPSPPAPSLSFSFFFSIIRAATEELFFPPGSRRVSPPSSPSHIRCVAPSRWFGLSPEKRHLRSLALPIHPTFFCFFFFFFFRGPSCVGSGSGLWDE